jgi:hypothetical protein
VSKNRAAMVGNQDITEFALVGEPVTSAWGGPKRPDRMLRRSMGTTANYHDGYPPFTPDAHSGPGSSALSALLEMSGAVGTLVALSFQDNATSPNAGDGRRLGRPPCTTMIRIDVA